MRILAALAVKLLAVFPVIDAYPEMAGSCGRPGGVHLPNDGGDNPSDGGFSVTLVEQPTSGPPSLERTGSVTLSHTSRRSLEGFLLRAVDASTLAEMGSFSQLAPSTELYEGCARAAASVTHTDGGIALPASMEITWPADRPLRLMFWPVDDDNRYYLAQTSSAAAPTQAASELDPRLESCPREALPLPAVLASLAGVVLAVAVGAVPAARLHPAVLKVAVPHIGLGDLLPMLKYSYYGVGGWTVGQLGVAGIWIAAQITAMVMMVLGINGFPLQAAAYRAFGKLAACGFMVIMLPVSRTSLWPKLVGLSYERALLWHRTTSTFTLLVTAVHGVGMVNDYGAQESFSALPNCFGFGNVYGTLILGAGGLLLLLSQPIVRRHRYRLFHIAHYVLVPAVLVLACLHISDLIYFLAPSVAIELVCNQIARIRQHSRKVTTTSTRLIGEGALIELVLCAPHIVKTLVRRGSTGLGSWVWLSMAGAGLVGETLDPHPFSVASINAETNELKLVIKPGGSSTWTARLAKRIKDSSAKSGETLPLAQAQSTSVQFRLDGPYGQPALPLAKYSTLVLVGGGIGVTPLLPILAEAAKTSATKSLPLLKRLVFVWSIRDVSYLEVAAAELQLAAQAAQELLSGTVIQLHLHLTVGVPPADLPGSYAVKRGRPDMAAIMRAAKQADIDTGGQGAMGFVCGPTALVRSVHDAGRSCGVPVHAESFEM